MLYQIEKPISNRRIQPRKGCNILVYFDHRLQPVVTHCFTPPGVYFDG